jgi:pyruvate dehydrogenase E1 component alpha subunit
MTSASSSKLDFLSSPINQALTPQRKVELYTQMVRIRKFEQAALKYYNAGKMGGFLHLYIGQEAVAVGTISLGDENDHFITAYRDHGHALAVGMGMNECMAEMFGKQTGCSKGKGGSMHFFAPDKNFWGGHGIVAGQTPLGLGLAYGLKYLGKEGCCLCYLGDGAVNQGAFHESLNIASLFGIPVVYVTRKQRLLHGHLAGAFVRLQRLPRPARRSLRHRLGRCRWLGSPTRSARKPTSPWSGLADCSSKPTLLEIDTYRYYGHSVADANTTRNTGLRRKSRTTSRTTIPSIGLPPSA